MSSIADMYDFLTEEVHGWNKQRDTLYYIPMFTVQASSIIHGLLVIFSRFYSTPVLTLAQPHGSQASA